MKKQEANRLIGAPARTQRSGSSGERRKEWSGRRPRRKAGTEQSGISSDEADAQRRPGGGMAGGSGEFEMKKQEANRLIGAPARTQRSGSSGERRKEWSGWSFRRKPETEQSGISSDAAEVENLK